MSTIITVKTSNFHKIDFAKIEDDFIDFKGDKMNEPEEYIQHDFESLIQLQRTKDIAKALVTSFESSDNIIKMNTSILKNYSQDQVLISDRRCHTIVLCCANKSKSLIIVDNAIQLVCEPSYMHLIRCNDNVTIRRHVDDLTTSTFILFTYGTQKC